MGNSQGTTAKVGFGGNTESTPSTTSTTVNIPADANTSVNAQADAKAQAETAAYKAQAEKAQAETAAYKAQAEKAQATQVEKTDSSSGFYIFIIFAFLLLCGIGFYIATKKKSEPLATEKSNIKGGYKNRFNKKFHSY